MRPTPEERQSQKEAVSEFVRELYKAAGFKSWQDFARDAGVLPSTISDWQRSENAPSGYNLLRLIWAARRKKETSDDAAARATDPVFALALNIARDMTRPLPEPPKHDPEMDEYLELVEAWDAAGRPVSGPIGSPPAGVEEAAAAIRELIAEQFSDLETRVAHLEGEASPEEEDPPAEMEQ